MSLSKLLGQKSNFLIPFLQIAGCFPYKLTHCVSQSWKTSNVFAFKMRLSKIELLLMNFVHVK